MWLLDARTEELQYFVDERQETYAILSHTWGEEEVSFQDIQNGCASERIGYAKVRYTCEQAIRDGFSWVWIDTLCINKESSAELSEAINSMYRWYSAAAKCYVYLSDAHPSLTAPETSNVASRNSEQRSVSTADPPWGIEEIDHLENAVRKEEEEEATNLELRLQECRWFQRGWTLQELIAPSAIDFFGPEWHFLGTKTTLVGTLARITNIERAVLEFSKRTADVPVAVKMSWAAWRQTTRLEDRAYSLLGIFDINMPLLYGEGAKAFTRLQEEIVRRSTDLSILVWNVDRSENPAYSPRDLLAPSPDNFDGCRDIAFWATGADKSYQITNLGLDIRLPVVRDQRSLSSEIFGVLNCRVIGDPIGPLALRLLPLQSENGQSTTFYIAASSSRYRVRVEELHSADDTYITILRDPALLDRQRSSNQKEGFSSRSVWVHFDYSSLQNFCLPKLKQTSTKHHYAQEHHGGLSLQDLQTFIPKGHYDLSDSGRRDTYTVWTLMKAYSKEVLMLGVAFRCYSKRPSQYPIMVFYRELDCARCLRQHQSHPKLPVDCATCLCQSEGIGLDNISAVLGNVRPSNGFAALIPGWINVHVQAEPLKRMGDEVVAVNVSLSEPIRLGGADQLPVESMAGYHDQLPMGITLSLDLALFSIEQCSPILPKLSRTATCSDTGSFKVIHAPRSRNPTMLPNYRKRRIPSTADVKFKSPRIERPTRALLTTRSSLRAKSKLDSLLRY